MDITIRRGNRGDLEQIMNLWLTGNRQGNDFVNEDYWELHYNQVRDLLLIDRLSALLLYWESILQDCL